MLTLLIVYERNDSIANQMTLIHSMKCSQILDAMDEKFWMRRAVMEYSG